MDRSFGLPPGAGSFPARADSSPPSHLRREGADVAAFEQLYDSTFPKVYGFIRSQVATTETAQELVSRVFLKAYRYQTRAPRGEAALNWIFRIAHTTLIDYWRVERRRERASLPIDDIVELPAVAVRNPEAAYERKRQLSDLLHVVNDLADDDRAMLAMKFAAHRTNRDIAVILNLSEGAVSMRLVRSLKRLRARLESMGWH
jgi:RNA polymerase sigma-70 factor (ECF subfamily)